LGRRNACTKVERPVPAFVESGGGIGMEGKYLKLGKRKADAVGEELVDVEDGGKEELLTRMLLNGFTC
jgi:hypothetical protein